MSSKLWVFKEHSPIDTWKTSQPLVRMVFRRYTISNGINMNWMKYYPLAHNTYIRYQMMSVPPNYIHEMTNKK